MAASLSRIIVESSGTNAVLSWEYGLALNIMAFQIAAIAGHQQASGQLTKSEDHLRNNDLHLTAGRVEFQTA